jgi:hypothetical protein
MQFEVFSNQSKSRYWRMVRDLLGKDLAAVNVSLKRFAQDRVKGFI